MKYLKKLLNFIKFLEKEKIKAMIHTGSFYA